LNIRLGTETKEGCDDSSARSGFVWGPTLIIWAGGIGRGVEVIPVAKKITDQTSWALVSGQSKFL